MCTAARPQLGTVTFTSINFWLLQKFVPISRWAGNWVKSSQVSVQDQAFCIFFSGTSLQKGQGGEDWTMARVFKFGRLLFICFGMFEGLRCELEWLFHPAALLWVIRHKGTSLGPVATWKSADRRTVRKIDRQTDRQTPPPWIRYYGYGRDRFHTVLSSAVPSSWQDRRELFPISMIVWSLD
jgi:hypothetical protein